MQYKYNFRDNSNKDGKKKIIYIICVIILAIIVSSFVFKNSPNSVISHVSNVVRAPFVAISNGVKNVYNSISLAFKDSKELIEENDKLKTEAKEMQLKLLEMQGIIDENTSLKEMLKIKNTYKHYDLKYASVSYRSSDNYNMNITIDIGKNDGVSIYDPVIHSEGLVGYVSSVTDDTSVVTTILDTTFSLSVTISSIKKIAMLNETSELKSNNLLKLKDIPIESEITTLDMVYTSGAGTMYPSGIPVGKIVKIYGAKNESDRYALVEPLVSIMNLNEVAVIVG